MRQIENNFFGVAQKNQKNVIGYGLNF